MLLTPYGFRTWGLLTLIALAIGAGLAALGWWWGLLPVGLAWLAQAWFFRDPLRRPPAGMPEGTMLSPADGTVSAVLEVETHEATGGRPARVIRIFLSVLDVHVNRSPTAGEVVALQHRPGRFFDARTDESARLNESNLITLRLESGEMMGVRQVAGKVARRIVCPLAVGDRLERGQKFGMIKFGSTAEVILPRPGDVEVMVGVGDKVRGGLTRVAVLKPGGVVESM